MTTATDDRLLLTQREAAGLLGLTERFLEARRARGGGPPHVRVSRRCIRYRRSDLEEWSADLVRESTSDPD